MSTPQFPRARPQSAPSRFALGEQLRRWAVFLAAACLGACATTEAPPTQTYAAATPIEIVPGSVDLIVGRDGWGELPGGKTKYPDAELALAHVDSGAIALVFVLAGAADSLDGRVLGRRELVFENHEVLSMSERRRFAASGRHEPVSVTEYRVRTGSGWAPIYSIHQRGAVTSVEVLTFGGDHAERASLIEALANGIRIHDPSTGGSSP